MPTVPYQPNSKQMEAKSADRSPLSALRSSAHGLHKFFFYSCSNFTFLCQPYRTNLFASRWRPRAQISALRSSAHGLHLLGVRLVGYDWYKNNLRWRPCADERRALNGLQSVLLASTCLELGWYGRVGTVRLAQKCEI